MARACLRQAKEISSQFRPQVVYGKFVACCNSAQLVARWGGVPWVISIGEGIWNWERYLIPYYGEKYLRDVLSQADAIETVSRELRGHLQERLRIDPRKITVIPNGVDTAVFRPRDKIEARKRLGLSIGIFLISFIGSTPNKGGRRLMEAIRLLPSRLKRDIGLVLMGDTSALADAENVEYAGKVCPEDMPWYLAATDMFVLPTTNEGMCNSILEAMAVGLPIVSSDKPFNHEVLCDDTAILVDPIDVEEISLAISRLYCDCSLRDRLGKAANKHSASMTSAIRMQRIEQMLRTTVGNYGR